MAARLAEAQPGLRVTCVNPDGLLGRWRVWRAQRGASRIELMPRLPYADYLRLIAGHRIVLQRDASGVPGQVAGDSLLAGTPCLGGDGLVDRCAFGDLPSARDEDAVVRDAATRLLVDDARWEETVARARTAAMERLSFAAFRRSWQTITSAWEKLG